MRHRRLGAFLLIAAQACAGTGALADDPAAAQFKKSCGTCHSVDPNAAPRQGPNLFGLIGRPAGSVDGFKYSAAFLAGKDGIVWDEATLDRWITDPQAMIPGAVMLYKQADPDKRRLVIEFLKTAH
jgi:cytochrome c